MTTNPHIVAEAIRIATNVTTTAQTGVSGDIPTGNKHDIYEGGWTRDGGTGTFSKSISGNTVEVNANGYVIERNADGAITGYKDTDGNTVNAAGQHLNADGHLVDAPGGNLINADGRFVNADGHLVDANGNLINSDGKFVNADDHLVDTNGELVNSDGHFVNAEGDLTDVNGALVDSEGHLVSPDGYILNTDGSYYEDVHGNRVEGVGVDGRETDLTNAHDVAGGAFAAAGLLGSVSAIFRQGHLDEDFKENVTNEMAKSNSSAANIQRIKNQYVKNSKRNWMAPIGLLVAAVTAFLFPPLLGALGVTGLGALAIGSISIATESIIAVGAALVTGIIGGKLAGAAAESVASGKANSFISREASRRAIMPAPGMAPAAT